MKTRPDQETSVDEQSVHKDFHGVLSYCIQHIYERYGEREMEECLRQIARNVYKPLIEALRSEGLPALERHWRRIYTLEGSDFELHYEGDALILKVKRCPALMHMRSRGYKIFERYCEHTRIVNEEICRLAGYASSVVHDQGKERCTQRFWKEEEQKHRRGI